MDFGPISVPAGPEENQTSPHTVSVLASGMARAVGRDRPKYLEEIGACRLPQSEPFILAALSDSDPLMRQTAARAAAQIADPALGPALRPLLDDPDPDVRREVAVSAGKLGDDQSVSTALGDSDATVVSAALSVAGMPQVNQICGAIKDWPSSLQCQAAWRLGELHARAAAPAILPMLGGSTSQKVAAINALCDMSTAESASRLIPLLKDRHPSVRRLALMAVTKLDPDFADNGDVVPSMLADSDATVREAAGLFLAGHPKPNSLPSLLSALPEPYPPARHAILMALSATGKPAEAVASKWLVDPAAARRADGSFILGQLGSHAAFERHLQLLDDPDPDVVLQAVRSLAQIGDPEASPRLVRMVQRFIASRSAAANEAMDGRQLQIAQDALLGCVRLNAPAVLPAASSAAATRELFPAEFRCAAIWAMGMLGDPAQPRMLLSLRPCWTTRNRIGRSRSKSSKPGGMAKYPGQQTIFGVEARVRRTTSAGFPIGPSIGSKARPRRGSRRPGHGRQNFHPS